ncbi:hypothetical protein IVB18_43640 [Bradyrhizobium sp. 186]|nr:hypothetical protein IVB18_43640 [Bradyrhizobium sp. 186]
MGYGRVAAGIEFVELSFRPEVTAEHARSTIGWRQQEDHDGESEEEEKQEGKKGQEGCSGEEEDRKEDRQEEVGEEDREKVRQEVCEEIGQEGRTEEGRQEGCSEEGCKEGREKSRAQEERGQEEPGQAKTSARSDGSADSRGFDCTGNELGYAFARRGLGSGRRAGLSPLPHPPERLQAEGP